ncbi:MULTISPECIES: hypothetical protein [unclassified Chelatococcus]|uniref:hypothetical protein n=1 Tax=unclassified Chelatococcus TaxID=2638111 RepID=UPI001BCEBC07|nr:MULTISPECIES: hypothetical protein [unclassified Chelatococcus]MBS7700794.1 hypothetical protein [Chelatococcus sp. YT9]MBX3559652.1 hypothetical protein [Chelatococcus sp.]
MEKDAELRAKSQTEDLKGGAPIPPLQADDHSPERPAVETPVEARQGFLDRPVLAVLAAGLALAMIAWVAVEVFAS